MLGWLFFAWAGATSLLADADTGWHIHTGEQVLNTGSVPTTDPFSFTMRDREWFAWEWLADVSLAVAHRIDGLRGVVLLAGAVIAATAAGSLRFMVWRGANILLAIPMMVVICSVSTMHWLARPHMYTWLFFLAVLWLLEADRRNPGRSVWWLVPLTAVWTNVHGGFVAALVTVGIFAVGTGLEDLWRERPSLADGWRAWFPESTRRYLMLFAGCFAATFVNPFGWGLHTHILGYLDSDFILKYVMEFRSPSFRDEGMKMLEATMLGSLLLSGGMIARGRFAWPLLIAAWAHATLTSVRHAPLFMMVAAPVLAEEASRWISAAARGGQSLAVTLQEIADDYSGQGDTRSERFAVSWLPLAGLAFVAFNLHARAGETNWTAQFAAIRFPTVAADALGERLKGRRILTTDQWGDYLIYRYYPEYRTFIDGRSDFYDPEIRNDYLAILEGSWKAERALDSYELDATLAPLEWALCGALKRHPDWELVYDDGFALLFERRKGGAAAGAKKRSPTLRKAPEEPGQSS